MRNFFLLTILFLTYQLYAQENILTKLPLSRSDSAQIYTNDSLSKYYYSIKDYRDACRYLENNAMLLWKHNYYNQAIKYYKKSIAINQKIQNFDGIAKINTNLALIYSDKGQYDSAYNYFEKTLAVRKAKNQKVGIISALINESVVLNKLKRYKLSTKKLEQALDLAREMNDIKQMRSCYGMLAETYQKAGNLQKSMYYYNFFKTFNDYVTNTEISKTKLQLEKEAYLRKIAELQAENQKLLLQQKQEELNKSKIQITKLTKEQQKLLDSLTKKEMVLKIYEQKAKIRALQNKNLLIAEKRKNIALFFTAILALSLTAFLIWLYFMYKKQKSLLLKISDQNTIISDQKEELENLVVLLQEKNVQLIDSINYASAIQQAIFSNNIDIQSFTKDSFKIYLPKNIVSGDFIFVSSNTNKYFIAVGDCTGHGVPGSFLTIVGYNLLNLTIKELNIDNPALILKEVFYRFYQILNQANTKSLDGMDIGLCAIDKSYSKLEFASESSKLLIAKNGETLILKGDKHPFGFTEKIAEKNYHKQDIIIEEKQWFYLYSDGIIHQFNSKYQKFSVKRLRQVIAQVSNKDGNTQKAMILDALQAWKQNTEQTDDITIVGFRIK